MGESVWNSERARLVETWLLVSTGYNVPKTALQVLFLVLLLLMLKWHYPVHVL